MYVQPHISTYLFEQSRYVLHSVSFGFFGWIWWWCTCWCCHGYLLLSIYLRSRHNGFYFNFMSLLFARAAIQPAKKLLFLFLIWNWFILGKNRHANSGTVLERTSNAGEYEYEHIAASHTVHSRREFACCDFKSIFVFVLIRNACRCYTFNCFNYISHGNIFHADFNSFIAVSPFRGNDDQTWHGGHNRILFSICGFSWNLI